MTEHRSLRPDVPAHTRARDVDRVSTLAILDDALMDGQLAYAEYRERVDGAGVATTVGDLDALIADLQPSRPYEVDAPQGHVGSSRSRRPGLAILAAVVAAIVAVVVALTVAPGSDALRETAAPRDPVVTGEMFTADGIRQVVDATRAKFGMTTVEGIHLYRDSAEIYVFDDASPVGHTHYDYSPGGEFYSPEFYSGLAVSASSAPVDLSKVDADRVAALIATAPPRLGVTTANIGRDRFRVTIGGGDGGEIWMGVNNMGMDSHLVAHLDGKVKGVARCGWGCRAPGQNAVARGATFRILEWNRLKFSCVEEFDGSFDPRYFTQDLGR